MFSPGESRLTGFLFLNRGADAVAMRGLTRTENRQQKSRPGAAVLCNGASDRARTGDPRFTRAVLYQLSYAGGHVVTQLRRQRLSMIRDIANQRKCSDSFSHVKCTNHSSRDVPGCLQLGRKTPVGGVPAGAAVRYVALWA